MALVLIGLVLTLLKLAGWSFVAGWPWWGVLAPFVAAAAWWAFADASGLTQRRAMARHARKVAARRDAQVEALGLGRRRPPPR